MFLDEELEQIYSAEKGTKECALHLLQACGKRLSDEYVRPAHGYYLEMLKRVDLSWQLFAKKHPELNALGFRNWVLRSDTDGKFKKILNW